MMRKMKTFSFFDHKLRGFFTRVFNMDIECRAAFLVLSCALLNMILSVIAVFAVGGYLLFSKQRFRAVCSDNNNILAFGFLALTFIVSLVYINILGAITSIFVFLCFIIMMNFRAKITRRVFEDFITLYLTYSVFAFVVAFIERYTIGRTNPIYRTCSTFINPLYYSYFIAIAVVFCAYRLAVLPRSKLMHTAVLIINIFAMLLSGGRLPWMGMFAGTLITLMLCRKYKLVAIFSGGIFLMVITAVLFPKLQILHALRLDSIDEGYNGRLPYWNMALQGFGMRPLFGRGFLGMLNDTIKADPDWIHRFTVSFNLGGVFDNMKHCGWKLHAHNILFDSLYNFGVFGTIALGLCILRYFTHMYRSFNYKSSSPHIALLAGIMVSIAVNGILDAEIIGLQTSVITVLIYAMTGLKQEKINKPSVIGSRDIPPAGRIVLPHN